MADGANRWPAVHRSDAARLFRLALEKGEGGLRYHAISDEGISILELAGVIGRKLDIPVVSKSAEEASSHFGFLAMFLGLDAPASATLTRERLSWSPTGPGLLADLEGGRYFDGGVSKFSGI